MNTPAAAGQIKESTWRVGESRARPAAIRIGKMQEKRRQVQRCLETI